MTATQPQLDDAALLQLALLAEITRHPTHGPAQIAADVRYNGTRADALDMLIDMARAGLVAWDTKAGWHSELPLVEQAEPDVLTIRLPANPDHRRALRGRIALAVRECAEDMRV